MKQKILIILTLCLSYLLASQAQNYPEMIKVEGGTFKMGDENGIGDSNETLHQVTLKSFSIAKTETTVLQWKTFCNETGRKMPESPNWGLIDNYPIVNVSWNDAVAFADWLSDKTGKLYRLPTEAEWEYAARGGSLSKGFLFSGGDSMDKVGWYKENGNDQAHSVAQKRSNELGLYDMSGNVWEWCSDWYGTYPTVVQANPKGAQTGSGRVLRGGSWFDAARFCQVVYRFNYPPSYSDTNFGFRLVSPE